jgi:CBS domain containing-hemolysin-like protein
LSTLQKPYIVSPRIMIDDLVEGFRSQMTQVALVMKDKKLIGMVTTEDVLEELVGKINETAKLEAAEGKQ